MRGPVFALIWESWQISRRQLLFIGSLSLFGCAALLVVLDDRLERGGAFVVWLLVTALAFATTLSLGTVGLRSGFPFARAFVRPVSTSLLVGVPLAFTAITAAACYVVPALAIQAYSGIAVPLLPVAAIIGMTATLFATCCWATNGQVTRAVGLLVGLNIAVALLGRLHPFGARSGGSIPQLGADLVRLDDRGYAAVALFACALYALAVMRIGSRRHGQSELHGRSASAVRAAQPSKATPGLLDPLRRYSTRLVRWRCPRSPSGAAFWFEVQGKGMPVIAAGLLLACALPLLLAKAHGPYTGVMFVFIGVAAAMPLLLGISACIWNRHGEWRAGAGTIDTVRPISTPRLVGLQLTVAVVVILAAYVPMLLSVWAATLLQSAATEQAQNLWLALTSRLAGLTVAQAVAGLVFFATTLALLMSLRVQVLLNGARVSITAVAVGGYALLLLAFGLGGKLNAAIVIAHLWAVAAAIALATVRALLGALRDHALTPLQLRAFLALWLVFVIVLLAAARNTGVLDAPRELLWPLAVTCLLPLWAAVQAPWSYARLRHA